jgi:calnexin
MQDGILFDNIYVGDSEKDAKALRTEGWAVKSKIEQAKEAAESPKPAADDKKKETDDSLVSKLNVALESFKEYAYGFRERVLLLVENMKEDPVEAIKEDAATAGLLLLIVLYGVFSIFSLVGLFGSSKKPVSAETVAKKTDAVTADDKKTGGSEKSVPSGEKASAATKRAAAKKSDD